MKVMTLRLPDDGHERLRREAFEQRTSITALIVAALQAAPVVTEERVERAAEQMARDDGWLEDNDWPSLATSFRATYLVRAHDALVAALTPEAGN